MQLEPMATDGIGVINGDGEKTGGLPLPEARTTLTLRLGLDGQTIAYGSDLYRDGTSPLMSRSIGGPRGPCWWRP